MVFRSAVAKFDERIEAAEDRDRYQALLDAPEPRGTVKAKGSEEPFADAFPIFASGFGIKVDKAQATPHLNGGSAPSGSSSAPALARWSS